MLNQVSRIALASAIALAAHPAWALDADDFGSKLKAAVQFFGVSVDYASATAEGNTVTLSDFTIYIPGEDDVEVPGDIVFSGVSEASDGGYEVERASTADIEIDDLEEDVSVSLRNIAVTGITIPAALDFSNILPQALRLYETASMGPLSISKDGEEVFSVASISGVMDLGEDMSAIATSLEISGISGDLSSIPDEEATEVLAAFGLEQFNGWVGATTVWYPETGQAVLEDFVFTVDDLAALRFSATIGGYTRAFYQEMLKINLKMAELAQAGETIQEAEMAAFEEAMLEKLMEIQVEKLAIRYEDASLFMKILDFAAAEQGIDGATLASGLKFMVPMVLAEVPDAAFKASVTRAVNAFIDNPQSIEIVAEPDSPVGVAEFAAAEDDPFVLVDLLNVQVRANQ